MCVCYMSVLMRYMFVNSYLKLLTHIGIALIND